MISLNARDIKIKTGKKKKKYLDIYVCAKYCPDEFLKEGVQ